MCSNQGLGWWEGEEGVAVLLDFAEGGKSMEIDLICYDLLFITIMLSNFFPGKKNHGKRLHGTFL